MVQIISQVLLPLPADECFELGRYAYNQKDYYHTVLWMQESLERLGVEIKPSVGKSTVLDYLAFSMSMVRWI